MSSDYRIGLVWTSQGGQLRADLERNLGTLTNMERGVRRNTRELGMFGQQMRAMGTTIRYALAGGTVYAVAGAVGSLGQFLDRLGEISALAGEIQNDGTFQGLGRELNTVGDMAVDLSNRFGIAVDEIQQHMMRFYSSFENQTGDRGIQNLRAYADTMAEIAMIAEGADPQALGGGIAGMVIGATPPGQAPNIAAQAPRMRDIIAAVLGATPTVRGEDIARDIGRLSAAQTASRMTPEEIWAVYGVAAATGGSPAVIGRGVTQMLADEIIKPQTEAQHQAFRRVGLPTDPTALRELGGLEILRRMMTGVAPGGASFANPGAMANLQDVDPSVAVAAAGGRGINLTLASQLFGQQESFRQFINLLSQGGVRALDEFIAQIERAKDAELGREMARERNEQRAYQQLVQTQRNVGLTLARGIDPVTRPMARLINRGGDWITEQNPAAVAGAVAGLGGAALATRLIFGTGVGGLAGRGLSRIPGVGAMLQRTGLGGLAGRAPGLAGAALIGSGVGAFQATGVGDLRAGSRSNPFWVVIDPQSWFYPGAPVGTGGEGGGGGGAAAAGRGVPPWLAAAGRTGGAAAIVTTLLSTPGASNIGRQNRQFRELWQRETREARQAGAPMLASLYQRTLSGALDPADLSEERQRAFALGRTQPRRAERMLQQIAARERGRASGVQRTQVEGEATAVVRLGLDAEASRMLRILEGERRVPVKLHDVAGGQRPSFRGKPKTQRGPGGR
jgi:hypothetical protein